MPQSCTATKRFILHQAGFGIHGDVGDLHARRAGGLQALARAQALVILAHLGDFAGAHLAAGGSPGEALVGTALDADQAVGCLQVLGLGAQRGRGHFEQLGQRVDGGFAGGGGDAADGGGTAGSAIGRQIVGADHQLDPAHGQAESFGRHLGDDGAGAGAEILGADLDGDGTVGVDHGPALRLVAAAAPGIHGDAQAALNRGRCRSGRAASTASSIPPARRPSAAGSGRFPRAPWEHTGRSS